METLQLPQSKDEVSLIVKYLQEGKVLVVPTDTVYGLVCDATNEEAVEKIFSIKKREKSKPLLVFVRDVEMAEKYAEVGDIQKEFLSKNWPGDTSVVLRAKDGLSKLVYKNGTIGLRQPNHGLIAMVLEEFKKPLAQTSANISGQPATVKIEEILRQFESQNVQPDLVVDAGDLLEKKPSKIVDFTEEARKIIRY